MARKMLLTVLAIPLLIVMVSKNPEAAAGIGNLLQFGAELLNRVATALNEFLGGLSA
jgi:hypothetical protein